MVVTDPFPSQRLPMDSRLGTPAWNAGSGRGGPQSKKDRQSVMLCRHRAGPGVGEGVEVGVGEEVWNLLVNKQCRGVRPSGLQVLHGIPLVDAALLRADTTFIVGGPDESHAPGEVVVPSSHFAGLVKDLQGRPGVRRGRRSGQAGTRSAGFFSWQKA